MIPKYIADLLNYLTDEFETHCLVYDWVYKKGGRTFYLKVNYPLSDLDVVLVMTIPTKGIRKFINFAKADFSDRIYEFINEESQRYGYNNVQLRNGR